MYSQIEKWVLQRLFGAKGPQILGNAPAIVDALVEVEQDVMKIREMQPGQSFSLPVMTEELFGITRTITITIGAPQS